VRRRLSLLVLAVTSMVVIAFVVPLGLSVRDQAESRALNRAQRTAQSVAAGLAVAESLGADLDVGVASLVVAITGDAETSVHLADGTIVGDAPDSPNVAVAASGRAFTARVAGGVEVLVPVTGDTAATVVRTFVTSQELTEGVAAAWLALGVLGVLLIGAAVVVAGRLGRSLVRPVTHLADAARRMADGDLEARVEPAGPSEIAAVGDAFNHLVDRLDDLLVAERESVADLSHRLRTPLTSLRLQVEMLPDHLAAPSLLADLDRLTLQVDALISDASRRSPARGPRTSDLGAVTRRLVEFWSVLADDQGRAVGIDVPAGPIPVPLSDEELSAAIETLLENVFAHTPEGAGYAVAVRTDPEGPRLVVDDAGPGFPDAEVVARGATIGGRTGLGLDIARRAAERTGGVLVIGRSPSGGGRVEMRFGSHRR